MINRNRYYTALATAFVITIGLLMWIGAIASIFVSCASHKEKVSIHKSDSISIVQNHTEHSSSFYSEVLNNFSFDSLIFKEKVVYADSVCPETAHSSERTLVIRGFRSNTIERTTEEEDSVSDMVAIKQHHENDSTRNTSDTQSVGASFIRLSPTDYISICFVLLLIVFVIRFWLCKCKKK